MKKRTDVGLVAMLSLAIGAGCADVAERPAAPIPTAEAQIASGGGGGTSVTSLTPADQEVPYPGLPEGASEIDPDAPKTFSITESGLRYRVLRKGSGKSPTVSNSVEVNYHGWLNGGKVFDSSYQRKKSISFPLNGVIPGWTEGMQLVSEGGMIEFEIPAKIGYGEGGMPPDIPGGATLHFLVELLNVK